MYQQSQKVIKKMHLIGYWHSHIILIITLISKDFKVN